MTTERVVLAIERDSLDIIQNLVWTTGKVIDAIRTDRGIDRIETTLLRDSDNPAETLTDMVIEVYVKDNDEIYHVARRLSKKIEAANRKHHRERGRYWRCFTFVRYLQWDLKRRKKSESYPNSGIAETPFGVKYIKIVVSPPRKWASPLLSWDSEDK